MMMTITSSITWIPLYLSLLYLIIKNNETMSQILLIFGFACLCLLLSTGVADISIKPWIERMRPCNDPMLKYQIEVVNNYRPRTFSFFSGHAFHSHLRLSFSAKQTVKRFPYLMVSTQCLYAIVLRGALSQRYFCRTSLGNWCGIFHLLSISKVIPPCDSERKLYFKSIYQYRL